MKKAFICAIAASVSLATAAVAKTSTTPDAAISLETQNAAASQISLSGAPGSRSRASSSAGADGMTNERKVTSDSGKRDRSKKGEKKLKGCIQSSRDQYTLEGKTRKMVSLNSSEDLSVHVGHMVALHGNWGANHVFYVNSVDMISDTCISSKGKHNTSRKDSSSAD